MDLKVHYYCWPLPKVSKQTLKIMKLIAVILFAACLQVSARGYSQITLSENNAPLQKVFQEIQKQSGYDFVSTYETLKEAGNVTVNVRDVSLQKALEECLKGKPLTYVIIGNTVVVQSKEKDYYNTTNIVVPETLPPPPIEIHGRVVNKNGDPLQNVSVLISGTKIGTATDKNGQFTLTASNNKNLVLEISSVGYETKKVSVGEQTDLYIVLSVEVSSLDDVVIIGYGKQKEANVTSSVSKISGDDIIKTKSSTIAQDIEGKIPGVQIRQGNGQPGSFSSDIQIRGLGSPIYVIDGVKRDATTFKKINPDNIESISVMKDGAAAIYGLDAANGAIIVTTKQGTKGKARFTFSENVSIIHPTSMLKVMNAAQYVEIQNEISMNEGTGPTLTPEQFSQWQKRGAGYESTDWLNQVFKKNAVSTNQNVSVEGGNDNITYFSSFGYDKNSDLTRGGDFTYHKFTGQANLTAKIAKNLTAKINISGTVDAMQNPNSGIFGLLFHTTITRPTESIYANGNPDNLNSTSPFNNNPIAEMNANISGLARTTSNILLSTATITYDIPGIKGLKANFLASYDNLHNRTTNVAKEYQLYSGNKTTGEITPVLPSINDPSNLNLYTNNNNNNDLQTQITYESSLNKGHHISAMLAYEFTSENSDYQSAYREYLIYVNPVIDQGSQTNLQNGGGYAETANSSYLGRISYNYKEKYFLQGAFRYNGSYRYAPSKRWGLFPIISGGWRISNEPFFKNNVSFITDLKLRGSYGQSGINTGNPFQYLPGYGIAAGGYQGWEFTDGTLTSGLIMPSLTNPDLTWVKSKMLDLGLDLSLWQKLGVTFDVYRRNRTGLLANSSAQVPINFGASLPQENLNADMTEGIELSVSYHNNTGHFNYGIGVNGSYARNMIKKQNHTPYSSSWDIWKNEVVNRWSGIGWGYNTNGQFQNMNDIYSAPVQTSQFGNTEVYPGDFKVIDENGDGYIDGNDLIPKYFTNEEPPLNYGLNLSASWKNFDFYALLQGSALYTIAVADNNRTYMPWQGNSAAYLYDRWHRADPFDLNSAWIPGENPTAREANFNPTGNTGPTPRNMVSGTYFRVKSIELGYSLPTKLVSPIGISKFRVYCNAYNIFTFYNKFLKNQEKVDPEETLGQDNRQMTYPIYSSLQFGVNIDF